MDLTEWKGMNFNSSYNAGNFNIRLINNDKEKYSIIGLVSISDDNYTIVLSVTTDKGKFIPNIFSITDTL
jgi:hypothetical protein